MNAVNGAVAKGISDLIDQTEADDDIWVVILTGAGEKAFCAGADLKEISRGNGRSLSIEGKGFGGLVFAKRTKPWIAEYIATGKHIPVDIAFQYGMINRLVPAGEHLKGAIALAETIIENAPIAVRESLSIARLAQDKDDDTLIQLMQEASLKVFQTADAKEGPLAFVEKRKPRWSGK